MLLYVLCSAIYHVIRPNSLCGPGASGVASEISEIFAGQVNYSPRTTRTKCLGCGSRGLSSDLKVTGNRNRRQMALGSSLGSRTMPSKVEFSFELKLKWRFHHRNSSLMPPYFAKLHPKIRRRLRLWRFPPRRSQWRQIAPTECQNCRS